MTSPTVEYHNKIKRVFNPLFLLYNLVMLDTGEKLGAFIVPTGVGAAFGGYAGDAACFARKFAQKSKLIVNPNVVNAGGFSGITNNMFYVEGYSLDEFFKGNINLIPAQNNKIGIVFDKAIPLDVLNVHINTYNAVKCVYGIDILGYEITSDPVGVEFKMEENGISTGSVRNVETILEASKKLLQKGCNAVALVCLFEDSFEDNPEYANSVGSDPVGGVEAIISHYISKELKIPCAHSPAFIDYQIYPEIVDSHSASEYITPTFLPCILLGLDIAPKLSTKDGISINNLDYLVMPYDSLGSTPVFEALKRNIPVYAIKTNTTVLNVVPEKISSDIVVVNNFDDCLEII